MSLILLWVGMAAPAIASAPPLRFEHLPLGSVARVLSARFHAPITILAQAAAPITGDFSGMDLAQALAAASKQAGLVVRSGLGGFILGPPVPAEAAAKVRPTREMLLRQRALLFEDAAKLGPP